MLIQTNILRRNQNQNIESEYPEKIKTIYLTQFWQG